MTLAALILGPKSSVDVAGREHATVQIRYDSRSNREGRCASDFGSQAMTMQTVTTDQVLR